MTLTQIHAHLESRLSLKRQKHSLAVKDIALNLAALHHLDLELTEKAALLHDIAKDLSDEKSLEKAKELGYAVSAEELENPALLHAPLGALILEKELGMNHPEILQAVKNHTTGCKEMSQLDLAVFVADYLDGAKKMRHCGPVESASFVCLEEAALLVCSAKIEYVLESRKAIAQQSIECYHWLLKRQKSVKV